MTTQDINDEFQSAYVLWIDNYTEGWHPHGCDSLEDCYKTAIDYAARTFVITRPPIPVAITEVQRI